MGERVQKRQGRTGAVSRRTEATPGSDGNRNGTHLLAVLHLELVPPGPAVAEVLVGVRRAAEPVARALDLAVGPEEAGDDDDDDRVVVRPLERVRRFGLALRPGLIPDRDGPQAARRRAVLQACTEEDEEKASVALVVGRERAKEDEPRASTARACAALPARSSTRTLSSHSSASFGLMSRAFSSRLRALMAMPAFSSSRDARIQSGTDLGQTLTALANVSRACATCWRSWKIWPLIM